MDEIQWKKDVQNILTFGLEYFGHKNSFFQLKGSQIQKKLAFPQNWRL